MSTGKWRQSEIPHKGWHCHYMYVIDREDGDPITCEMCETAQVRFVHVMRHEETGLEFKVGCYCAGAMESDYQNSNDRERQFKNERRRRAKFPDRGWRISRKGNDYLNIDDFNITIFKRGVMFAWVLKHESTYTKTCPKSYVTEREAKLSAFDEMISLKATKPWRSVVFRTKIALATGGIR